MWEIRDGKVTETDFDPTVDLGLAKISVEQLKGGEPDVNAAAFTDFLAGKDIPSRTTALLNAASAIVADGNLVGDGTLAERFREAYALAENTVDSGKAAACSASGSRPPSPRPDHCGARPMRTGTVVTPARRRRTCRCASRMCPLCWR